MESVDRRHQHFVLYSGGPDSYITYHEVKRLHRYSSVVPLYFNLGHRYLPNELRAVGNTLPLTTIDGSFSSMSEWEERDAHIFARNALLLLGMARYVTGPATLYLSVQKDELGVVDRQPIFMDAMSQLFGVLGLEVEVVSLWLSHDKTDMVKHFVATGGTPQRLCATWSCYDPVGAERDAIHCGDCPACVRRSIAFTLGMKEDITPYSIPPRSSRTFLDYLLRARSGAYSEGRCQRILEAASESE